MLMQALTAKVSKSGVIAMEHPKEDIIDDLRASCLLSENQRQFYSNVNTLRHIFSIDVWCEPHQDRPHCSQLEDLWTMRLCG